MNTTLIALLAVIGAAVAGLAFTTPGPTGFFLGVIAGALIAAAVIEAWSL